MMIIVDIVFILVFFVVLGWMADIAVHHIRYLCAALKIRLFVFGILLGLITTLPELSLGINASLENAGALAVGNLIGGMITVLGLILGLSLVLNHSIVTDGRLAPLLPTMSVVLAPILFGLDGKYGLWDGMAMIFFYVGLIYYLYRMHRYDKNMHHHVTTRHNMTQSVIFAIIGIIGILITSHWIIVRTLDLLTYINVSQIFVGFVVFSIGTNLPEISIAISSWRKKTSELSLSHLLSSVFTNVLILGIIAFINPILFDVTITFYVMACFLVGVLILFTIFYCSDRKMDRREGVVLLVVYVVFFLINILFLR